MSDWQTDGIWIPLLTGITTFPSLTVHTDVFSRHAYPSRHRIGRHVSSSIVASAGLESRQAHCGWTPSFRGPDCVDLAPIVYQLRCSRVVRDYRIRLNCCVGHRADGAMIVKNNRPPCHLRWRSDWPCLGAIRQDFGQDCRGTYELIKTARQYCSKSG